MSAADADDDAATAVVVRQRLESVLLTANPLPRPEDVVRRLLAVQSQDYAPALWSLGQRSTGGTERAMHDAVQSGRILRTHVLRPTWHLVLPEDVGWLLALTSARVHQLNAFYYRKEGLEEETFARADEVLAAALAGRRHRTRAELVPLLAEAGLPVTSFAAAYLLMHAELEGLICSGERAGRQHTYALLAERAPAAQALTRDEALAELAVRYFTGHGPATAKDLHWWSSLPLRDISAGISGAGDRLARSEADGLVLFSAPPTSSPPTPPELTRAAPAARVHLLQGYDEYVVGYSESKRLLDPDGTARDVARASNRMGQVVLVDGEAAGVWKRTVRRDDVLVEVDLYRPIDAAALLGLRAAADGFGAFLGKRAELTCALGTNVRAVSPAQPSP